MPRLGEAMQEVRKRSLGAFGLIPFSSWASVGAQGQRASSGTVLSMLVRSYHCEEGGGGKWACD